MTENGVDPATGLHDVKTCPVCGPIVSRRAWKRGVEEARKNQALVDKAR